MFCLLLGDNEDHFDHIARMPLGPLGASLLELQELAKGLGRRTEVRRFPYSAIRRIPLPAVVQLHSQSPSPGITTHFSVLLRADRSRIELLDGTTGRKLIANPVHFERFWTGNTLVPEESWAARLRHRPFLLGVSVVLLSLPLYVPVIRGMRLRRH